jgi:hypothetical protein
VITVGALELLRTIRQRKRRKLLAPICLDSRQFRLRLEHVLGT